jgi:hypothetical protein
MLGSARISGRREHIPRSSWETVRPLRGEIVADAVWEGIISPEDSDRIRLILDDPDRQRYNPSTGRKYLLSGVLKCGLCNGGMVGRPKDGTPRYVCPNTPGYDTCGKTATIAKRTDEYIRDMILVSLDSPEVARRLNGRDNTTDTESVKNLRIHEERLEELAAAWATGEITRKEWMAARSVLEKKVTEARAFLARNDTKAPLRNFIGTLDQMRSRWENLNVSQQQSIVTAVLRSIRAKKANPKKKWDPDRFELEWVS